MKRILLAGVAMAVACSGDSSGPGGPNDPGGANSFTANVSGLPWTAEFITAVPVSCTNRSGVLIGASAFAGGGLPEMGFTIMIKDPAPGLSVSVPNWQAVVLIDDASQTGNTVTPNSTGTVDLSSYGSGRVVGTMAFSVPSLAGTGPFPSGLTVTSAQFSIALGAVDSSEFACTVLANLP